MGASRVCDRRLSRCLLGPGCSLDLLLIWLLRPLTDDAVTSSRAEVVDRDDTVKHRFVFTELFGPVFRFPINLAKTAAVLVQLDLDVSDIMPDNNEPVFLIVVVLTQLDVVVANLANNSLFLTSLLGSFVLASILRPFLNLSVRVNHFVDLVEKKSFVRDLVQASLEQVKGGWVAPLHCLEGLLLRGAPVAPRLRRENQLDDRLLQGSPLRRLLFSGVLLLGRSRPNLRAAEATLY